MKRYQSKHVGRQSLIAVALAATFPLTTPDAFAQPAVVSRSNEQGLRALLDRPLSGEQRVQAGAVRLEVARNDIPADGQTPTEVTLKLYDTRNALMKGTHFVTIEVSSGRIQLPDADTDESGPGRIDADRVIKGVQLKVVDGTAKFLLLAPHEPQEVTIRAAAGDVFAQGKVSFVPELRDMIAVGLVEGIINVSKFKSSELHPVRQNDGFEYELERWSREWDDGKRHAGVRTAFFLKGKIKGDYLLTLAYDSEKETRNRLFRDIHPDEFYPVYGDSSIIGFDARTSDRLYVRIDKNRSYLLYGDFTTADGFTQGIGQGGTAPLALRQLGNYSRSVTGVKHHYESGGFTTNVFAMYDSVRQVIDELPGRGVSGPYSVSNNNGLQNTEKVEIIVRDRNQPNVVLSVTPMARFTDYVFEPFSGQLLFTRPIPTVDANLNPVSVRVTYEVDQGGEQFWTIGLDGQARVNDRVEVGGSYVNEDNPLAPYRMASANVGIKLGENTSVVAEMARTDGTANTNGINSFTTAAGTQPVGDVSGNAARVELRHKSDAVEARAYAIKTDEGFNNPSSGLAAGRTEAGAKVTGTVTDKTRVYGELLHSRDDVNDGQRSAAQVGVRHQVTDTLEADVALRRVKEDGNVGYTLGNAANTSIGSVGNPSGGFYNSGANAVDPLSGTALINGQAYSPTLQANAIPQDTTSLRGRLTWRPGEPWALYGEIERDVEDSKKNRFAVGADYQFAERSKLYARYEDQTGMQSYYSLDPAQSSNAFIVGVDAGFSNEGQVYSEYRLRDAIGDRQLQAANGIRNTWSVAEGVRLQAGAERLKVFDGDAQSSTALTFGVEYTPNPLWKASGRLEWRKLDPSAVLDGNQAWMSTAMVARKLSRDWTMLARNYLYLLDNRTRGDQLQDRFQIGVAYRDTDTNRINALARYEYKLERNDALAESEERKVHIFSTHADYHPHRQWWYTARLAGKHVNERFGSVHDSYSALLASGRVTYDINDKWDMGAMLATLYSPRTKTNQWAFGLEAGYQVQRNLWVSLGYNVSGFTDRDLTASEYTARGLFLRLRFKFDETFFGGK